jgi:hypothetical protein
MNEISWTREIKSMWPLTRKAVCAYEVNGMPIPFDKVSLKATLM